MIVNAPEYFRLDSESAYLRWKSTKLAEYPLSAQDIITTIENPEQLTQDEKELLSNSIGRANMAIFRLHEHQSLNFETLPVFGRQLGLLSLDKNLYANESAISELRVSAGERRGDYIPYTNRALKWHTDGYYNSPQKSIQAFILYCQSDSAEGGENELLDPELAYIHLRDRNPEYIKALMYPDVLTIPETTENDHLVRPEQQNPVFSVHPLTSTLHMRYTERRHNIKWNSDTVITEALQYLRNLLQGECNHILRYRLQPNEGLICNNVLHNRSAFADNFINQRVMLRARYYDRITI